MLPVSLLVIGAGERGTGYANWVLEHPDRATVVGVAEPRAVRRARLAEAHGIAPGNAVSHWKEFAARGRIADAVLICTLDREHLAPVEAFAALGYHILLEKPMAVEEESCQRVVAAVEKTGVMLAVGHVLRYTPYTQALKAMVDSGRLGDIISIQHLEPVGFWHQAHSFVRGNWRRADGATFMLMAKSCHDLDWLQYIVGQPPKRVSSFGGLSHFTPANRPAEAADRCPECPVARNCPYSATHFYGGMLERGEHHWPLSVVVDDFTPRALDRALRTGPYGRCVYACDNDVVDHQVVAMEFAGGATATFTMTAFNEAADRKTRIFGTRGELYGDGETLRIHDFLTRRAAEITPVRRGEPGAAGGHNGGDAGLMDAFVEAVATGDPASIRSGPRDSLAGHLAVLAAERARLNGTVETVPAWR
ncbi:Gfo/Idh/MocA family protein [Streptomyces orinoci]|uniref:Gfo/Idh/MocA family oxidoreductase n=1 Tax=Streptomyces orinoci TaxID=67339 RepID=A0ABV3K0B0_STRON|nr:Gfo/Idh/MocA family oxidoreductase [Streptomyces orinoci]